MQQISGLCELLRWVYRLLVLLYYNCFDTLKLQKLHRKYKSFIRKNKLLMINLDGFLWCGFKVE